MLISLILAILAGAVCGLGVLLAIMFRRVVPTNMVHIVQSKAATKPYGTKQENGNVYYKWPSWVPKFGVTVIALPVSNFDVSLASYEAYDKDRVPFVVDVTAFFRIKDTALAAQRVTGTEELHEQLSTVVQGAVRKVLASDNIDNIMLERAKFGKAFTDEVQEQLEEWGVEPVKSMELMDIRDGRDSKVISNIMAKKTSFIEMESRKEVASNTQSAEMAEIEAQRAIEVSRQEAEKLVGQQTAEKQKAIGIANQSSMQEILAQEKITKERTMEVKRVEQVKQAEIARDQAIVAANEKKQTTVIIADGDLEAKKKESEGIRVRGEAEADAEKAMQLAPVQAQITLAKEIGANKEYQQYLVTVEAVRAYTEVGKKQAEALQDADIKIISNAGKPLDGLGNVSDLFTTTGGTNIAGMIEALAQTPMGQAALNKLGISDKSNGADPKKVH